MKRWIAAASIALLPATALAGPGDRSNTDNGTRIYNGQTAQTCAWPTTVAVTTGGGLCTGTLVHDRVVVYAAHCGASSQTRVRFGERSSGNPLTITPERCETNPEYNVVSDQDKDWAYCVLPDPIDIPATPMTLGCEHSLLTPGTQVAIIGYGNNQTGGDTGFGAGTKRWALASLIGINLDDNVAAVSEIGEPAICSGDSGGPAMARYPDGSWHAFGITSTGPAASGCAPDAGRIHSMMAGAAPWLEERVGFDITPCHDPDGTWNPNSECQGFNSAEPGAAFGTWNDGCIGAMPISPPSAICGPATGQTPDTTPPTITLNSPVWGDEFPLGATVDIDSTVMDDTVIKGVRIEINGEDIGVLDDDSPYAFPATFGDAGQYEIVAIAFDWSGNSARSNAALIAVGDTDPLPPDPTSGTGGDEDGGTTGWVPGAGEGEDGGGGGCSCSTAPDGSGSAGSLALLLLAAAGRRRRN